MQLLKCDHLGPAEMTIFICFALIINQTFNHRIQRTANSRQRKQHVQRYLPKEEIKTEECRSERRRHKRKNEGVSGCFVAVTNDAGSQCLTAMSLFSHTLRDGYGSAQPCYCSKSWGSGPHWDMLFLREMQKNKVGATHGSKASVLFTL